MQPLDSVVSDLVGKTLTRFAMVQLVIDVLADLIGDGLLNGPKRRILGVALLVGFLALLWFVVLPALD